MVFPFNVHKSSNQEFVPASEENVEATEEETDYVETSPAAISPQVTAADEQVPITEKFGWVDTGAVSVAILPRTDESKTPQALSLQMQPISREPGVKILTHPNEKTLDFELLDGSKVQVPFMTTKTQFMLEDDRFKVLGLPYLQGEDKRRFRMLLTLVLLNPGCESLVSYEGCILVINELLISTD
ncbi:serpin-ZX [Artemisia annua]|uniref:Serpin-ZX n=1 Tax=Artemisia annua TaxID=35608 RepID=A0A2U1NVZ6_ARTAN|nr:serpin-ZX [Artemisia annua]